MNVEQNRLETFRDWPQDAAVTPSRIAKAGFFSTNQNLTVECFSCHVTISDWNYGDQVMARHRILNPNCPFVLNPTTSGNVPIISPAATPSNSVPSSSSSSTSSTSTPTSNDFKDEAARLKTFEGWPVSHIVAPSALAKAGFYYLKTGDQTKCAFCNGVVRAWEVGDDPDKEHKKYFQDCPYVVSQIIPRLNLIELEEKNSFSNVNLVSNNEKLHALGVQTHKGPKKPKYGTVEARLRSFDSWPRDLIQTPETLSQAGFYYEGMGDQVRCFHCDGGLRHWDPQDDPWTEHARWFPRCSFIKLVKGQDFVNACSLELNVTSNLEEIQQKTTPSVSQSRRYEVTEREIQEQMTSEAALSALSIGLNVERVKRAIREKLEQTGRGYCQPDALVEAALNLQHDEDDGTLDSHDQQQQQQRQPPTSISNEVKNVLEQLVTNSVDSMATTTTKTTKKPNQTIREESKPNKTITLEEENRLLKEARLCKICMDVEVGIVFLPCGHLATCVNCAPNLEDCPVCRSAIKATVRTFLS